MEETILKNLEAIEGFSDPEENLDEVKIEKKIKG